MDLFIIHGIAEELKGEIVGGFITKIYQMNRTDLLIRLRRLGDGQGPKDASAHGQVR